jgi:NAD(P)-dependent dehydrogenase (short-subunit alcohol dehydrogenase family)
MQSDLPSLIGKTCVVTGATTGIGAATALGLAQLGANVIVLGRNEARAQAVLAAIRKTNRGNESAYFLADLSSQEEVHRVADALPSIDLLINNAGAVFSHRQVSQDGIEMTFALNHLAGFLLTNLLLQKEKIKQPGRVINVSSFFHFAAWMNFHDLQWRKFYFAPVAYAQSKLANVLFTVELAYRLQGSGITVNAVDPGLVDTNLGQGPGLVSAAMRLLNRLGGVSPEKGAQTSLYLAASAEVNGFNGEYFSSKKVRSAAPAARNMVLANRLWKISAELTGLPEEVGINT